MRRPARGASRAWRNLCGALWAGRQGPPLSDGGGHPRAPRSPGPSALGRGGANRRRQEPFAISTIMRYAATTKMRLPMVKPMKIGSQEAMSTVELMVLSTIALPRR